MSTGDDLTERFLAHRTATLEMLARMPDDRVDFRPWPGAHGFGQIALHIGSAHHMVVGVARGLGVFRPDPASLPADLPSIRRMLANWTEEDAAAIRAMSAADLATETVGMRDRRLAGRTWLAHAREHEAHHKGHLLMCLRLCGIEPPAWKNW